MNRKVALVLVVLVGAIVALVAWRRDDARAPAASAPAARTTPAAPAAPAGDAAIDETPRESEAAEPQVASEATEAPSAQSAPAVAASEPPPTPARVRVHVVTPDGEPFELALDSAMFDEQLWRPSVLVTLEPTAGPSLPPLTHEEATALGTFTPRPARTALPPSCVGELELRTQPPVFVTLANIREWLGCQPLAAPQEDVEFVLDPAPFDAADTGVRVRIVDSATKLGVAGAQVGLASSAATGMGSQLRAGRDGSAAFLPWIAGPCTLSVHARGYASASRELDVRRGELLDVGDVEIHAATPVHVRVKTDLPSEQVALVCRTLEVARGRAPAISMGGPVHQAEDGHYEVYPGEGELVLYAQATTEARAQLQSSAVMVTAADAGTTMELELREVVQAVLHTGWIGEGRTIEIRDALDIPVWRPWSPDQSPMRLPLVPGTYRVLFGGDGAPAPRTIEIAEAATEITLD